MSEHRILSFRDESDVIEEIQRLRLGCHSAGNWSLSQTCWHLNTAPANCLHAPQSMELTAEQATYQRVLDGLLAAGQMPAGLAAPEGTAPPPRVDDSAVDDYIASLERLRTYRASHAAFSRFGPVPIEKFRQFVLIHSAHHLGMLSPTA